jgi:thiol-disulfide isomerase/thioredoxin
VNRGFAIVLAAALTTTAMAQSRGIDGRPAKAWNVEHWINLPEGAVTLEPEAFAGKVIYLYCFQSWCPGCHSRGFPTLVELKRRFKGDDGVVFVAVQTAFEGHQTNTPESAKATAQRYGLSIPVGHTGSRDERPKLMATYRTGGTPWTIIIDRNGVVRFDDFHISPDRAEVLIKKLEKESWVGDVVIDTLAKARGGQDLIGKPFPDLGFEAKPAKATLYRWWTDDCPWCAQSLPAIETWRSAFEGKGLRTVAVYHPKPPRTVTQEDARKLAKAIGYNGEVVLDLDWSALKKAYLDSGNRRATSVTILVDDKGIVRFVHPGPVFFDSDKAKFKTEDRDHAKLEKAIRALLR